MNRIRDYLNLAAILVLYWVIVKNILARRRREEEEQRWRIGPIDDTPDWIEQLRP